MCYNAKTRLF